MPFDFADGTCCRVEGSAACGSSSTLVTQWIFGCVLGGVALRLCLGCLSPFDYTFGSLVERFGLGCVLPFGLADSFFVPWFGLG